MNKLMIALLIVIVGGGVHQSAVAQVTMNNYTAYPPFINKSVPPAVMLMMTKDHRLFFKGYNDIVDLDNGKPGGDAAVDTTYKDNIDYVGYFDPKKCYAYTGGAGGFADTTGWFVYSAAGVGAYGHSCTNLWSGNFMNWATMARIDIIRKVLYGGKRIVDDPGTSLSSTSGSPGNGLTVLGRTITPRDAHSWAKVYAAADVGSFVPSGFTSGSAITICNTNSAAGETVGYMMVLAGSFPDADSTEVTQCSAGAGNFVAADVKATYRVAVKVCDWTAGLEANCDTYLDDNPVASLKITYKPQGLLQRMAVNSNGSAGTVDDTITMRFGLISGSYSKNFSGGVLRSKVADLYGQEINRKTGQILGTSQVIKTIDMFRVVGYNFGSNNYTVGGNDGTCSVNGDVPVEGNCKSWGEPFAEMFYEAVRYFRGLAGTGGATTQFYAASPDGGVQSYAIGDGTFALNTFPVVASGSYADPYTGSPLLCEYCAKPFVLMFGDAFPSHDSDQLPGTQPWSSAPGAVTPTPNDIPNLTTPASAAFTMSTLLTNSQMDTLDPFTSAVIGEVGGGTVNSICSAKAATSYINLRGLCPEEPNKYGSFYLPMLAHYAKTQDLRGALGKDTTNLVSQNITTFAVVASAPVPILEFTVGGNKVQLTPAFHSGCPDTELNAPVSDPKKYLGCQAWGGNSSTTTPISLNGAGLGAWGTFSTAPLGSSAKGGNKGQLVAFDLCASDADWNLGATSEQIANGYTSCYEIQWDDATYGGDFDLDLRYRIYVKTGPTTITVKTKPIYANSGNGNWAGFYINGVSAAGHTATGYGTPALNTRPNVLTGSGEYYDIRCGDNIPKSTGVGGYPSAGPSVECQGYNPNGSWNTDTLAPYPTIWAERTFTVNGTNAGLLKDPLWYASKYGGFKDSDKGATPGFNLPDKTSEWDADGNGLPDTYFYAQNPLELEGKLAAAFAAILNQTSSGTAASVLSSSTAGEGGVYQSYFFPTQFEAEKEIKYTGYVQGLFVDKFGNMREDTNGDGRLTLEDDRIVVTRYDSAKDQLAVDIYVDVLPLGNADGKADPTRDTNGDLVNDTAVCDDVPHQCDKTLADVTPIWEGGRRLAIRDPDTRKIYTWVDLNNSKVVDAAAEFISFDTVASNKNKIAGYLNLSGAPAAFTTDNVINFIRGKQITGLRDRTMTVKNDSNVPTPLVWKLGDSVYSTPVVVGAPKERYDVLYGDASYISFFQMYKNRRQVAYLGANDGMIHAFNVGVFTSGDAPFSVFGDNKQEHGWFTNGPAVGNGYPSLVRGDELWGFIPQELLPHLRWLVDPSYTHVYYVDLKPKITDVRIFDPSDPDHPNGWGTILIGGFRMGGSCGTCGAAAAGAPMTFAANFDNVAGIDAARTFLSSYFVLDITNPEVAPKLLWSYSDTNMGFTMSYPSVVRVRPLGGDKTLEDANTKWFVMFGSGPTSYDAGVGQVARMYAVDAKARMTSAASATVTIFDAGGSIAPPSPPNSFIGDLASIDRDLDYRADVVYGGKVINASPWEGKLLRLTTGCWQTSSPVCNTDPGLWGVPSGGTAPAPLRAPSEILYQFMDGGTPAFPFIPACPVPTCNPATPAVAATAAIPAAMRTLGPVPQSVGLALDQTGNLWVFAGTGRYYTQLSGTGDKIDTSTQYLVGVKDPVLQGSGGCSDATITGCRISNVTPNELVDLSSATICQLGNGTCGSGTQQVTNVPALSTANNTYGDLITLVQSKKGWVTKLTVPASGDPSERSVATPVVLGGIVFFPTFLPSGDLCVAAGSSNLYALYYVTGGAYSSPVVGMAGQNISNKMSLGEGLATTVAIHLGAQGAGTTGAGSLSGVKGCSQSSTGAINCVNVGTASAVTSRYLSWINQRD